MLVSNCFDLINILFTLRYVQKCLISKIKIIILFYVCMDEWWMNVWVCGFFIHVVTFTICPLHLLFYLNLLHLIYNIYKIIIKYLSYT